MELIFIEQLLHTCCHIANDQTKQEITTTKQLSVLVPKEILPKEKDQK